MCVCLLGEIARCSLRWLCWFDCRMYGEKRSCAVAMAVAVEWRIYPYCVVFLCLCVGFDVF